VRKVIRLTESDLVRLVKRVISEQYFMDQEEFPKNTIANEVITKMDDYKSEMENFLDKLKSEGDVDKRRFMSRIKNGTMEIYREILNGLDTGDSSVIDMLDSTFAHKQQELYGHFHDLIN
jgi:hypothetical protein